MTEIQYGGFVPVPREQVFDYVTDPRHLPQYFPGVDSVDHIEGAAAPGRRWQVSVTMLGRRRRFVCELTELDRPRLERFVASENDQPSSEHEGIFLDAPGGTQIRFTSRQLPRSGFGGIVDRTVARWAAQRMGDRAMKSLTAQLSAEHRQAPGE